MTKPAHAGVPPNASAGSCDYASRVARLSDFSTMDRPSFLSVYFNRRAAALLGLGFASGLPAMLTQTTLQAWLKDMKVDLKTIGLFSVVTLPYTLKFIWAPLMDRYVPPLLGRRRGWLLVTQLLLIVSIVLLAAAGGRGTGDTLTMLAAMALVVAFMSASQDIVADAYRTDVLPTAELAAGAAVFVTGYRVGLIAATAGALELSGHTSWFNVYLVMAALMSVGIVATLLAPQPPRESAPATLDEAVVRPLVQFLRRRGAVFVLLFIVLFKLPDVVAKVMALPMLKDMGFDNQEIGRVQQGLGLLVTIIGALVGGGVVARLGLIRSLWLFGILQAVSNLGYLALAITGKNYAAMVTVIAVENFCGGLVTAGFVAYLMSQCDSQYSAFQYALLTSLMAFAGTWAGAPTGYVVEHVGYAWFFVISVACGVPGMLMLFWLPNIAGDEKPSEAAAAAK